MSDKEYIESDFVFCGLIFSNNAFSVVLCQITANGVLMDKQYYDYKKTRDRVIGGIYSGASFYEGGVKGLDGVTYKTMYHDQEEVIRWKAKTDQARKDERLQKLEKNAKKKNEIEEIILPLRKIYAAYRKQNDYAGMEAIEAAVMRALRTPIRKLEADNE